MKETQDWQCPLCSYEEKKPVFIPVDKLDEHGQWHDRKTRKAFFENSRVGDLPREEEPFLST